MAITAPISTPPLREGDHLSREEFLRRWEAMPDLNFAELIDGVVYMPSPVSEIHSDFHGRVSVWLAAYVTATPGCVLRPVGTWLMSKNSAPQPDLALKILPECGGQSKIEGKYPAGAPELIAEVSHTTAPKDTGAKLRLYERSGVRECVVVRPKMRELTWYSLVEGKFREQAADADGVLRSRVFPGLWLQTTELWNGDYADLAATIQNGVATNEHAAFVRKLASYQA
jgi:hypothetical protein